MARFKSVTKNFTSLPNEVIQGFYLSPNALAVLITCLSYPNDWEYRPIAIWKKLKLSRDKTYAAFDELVEKGHCIRIRHLRGNLRAEVDYIFFDEVKTCQGYIESNDKELNANNIQVEHKWNLKKCFRHPESQETEGWEPEGQEVLKKISSKTIEKKRCYKESNTVDPPSHVQPAPVAKPEPIPIPKVPPPPEPPKPIPDAIDSVVDSIPSNEGFFSIDSSIEELLSLEDRYLLFFRSEIVARWINKFGAFHVLQTIKFFFHITRTQKKAIDTPERWMEAALKDGYAKASQMCEENRTFAEDLKKRYRINRLKINKRYCQDMHTGKDYYYSLPTNVFQGELLRTFDVPLQRDEQ